MVTIIKWIAFLIGLCIIFVPPALFIFNDEVSSFEIRYYVFIFFIMVFIMVFGVLRLYNSVVANSKFLIYLNNAIKSLIVQTKHLETATKNSSKEMQKIKQLLIDRKRKKNE